MKPTINPSVERRINKNAKKQDSIIYDGATHAYWSFGEKIGKAFSDGKQLK